MPQNIAQITLLSSKVQHFHANRNYFKDAKTHIDPYFLNEWLYMSDFSVLDMRKALFISAPCPEVPYLPFTKKMNLDTHQI
jgi:hypothetical protein